VRYAIKRIGAWMLLGALGWYVVSFATADGRVRRLCAEIRPGVSVVALNRYADGVGLGPPARLVGTSFMVERKTFARYGCEIEAVDGTVQAIQFDASN
jgi:hypothetical protein